MLNGLTGIMIRMESILAKLIGSNEYMERTSRTTTSTNAKNVDLKMIT